MEKAFFVFVLALSTISSNWAIMPFSGRLRCLRNFLSCILASLIRANFAVSEWTSIIISIFKPPFFLPSPLGLRFASSRNESRHRTSCNFYPIYVQEPTCQRLHGELNPKFVAKSADRLNVYYYLYPWLYFVLFKTKLQLWGETERDRKSVV